MKQLFVLFAVFALACGGSVSRDSEANPEEYADLVSNETGGSSSVDSLPEITGEAGSPSVGDSVEEGGSADIVEDPSGEAGSPPNTGGSPATGGTVSHTPASTGGNDSVAIGDNAGASTDSENGGSDSVIIPAATGGEGGSSGSDPSIIGDGGAAGSVGSAGGATGGEGGSAPILTVSVGESPYSHSEDLFWEPRLGATENAQPSTYGWYRFTNTSDGDLSIDSVTVREINPHGKMTDFEQVILGDTGGAYGGMVVLPEAADQDAVFDLDRNQVISIVVPAHGEIVFPLSYRVADVVPSSEAGPDSPRSGDSPQLEIVRVTANDGTVEAIVEPQEHAVIVLRKSVPGISWDEIAEPLHDGLNTIARLTISPAGSVYTNAAFVLQQMLFDIEASEGLVLESPEEGSFFLGGEDSSFGRLHVSGAGALGVLMNPVEDWYVAPSYPMTIEIRAIVSGVQSGSSVSTRLAMYDADEENRTVQILGGGSPGILLAGPHLPDPPFTSGLLWSDLSEEDDHVAYSQGDAELGTSSVQSSQDYATAYLVPGADGSSTVTAP